MRRLIALVLPLIVWSDAGLAAGADDIAICNRHAGVEAIAACTRAIDSKELAGSALALAHVNRALALTGRDHVTQAIADLDEALRLDAQNAAGPYNREWPVPLLRERLNRKIKGLSQVGRRVEAVGLGQRALKILERRYGRDNVELVDTLTALADAYRKQGNVAEADTLSRRALAINNPGQKTQTVTAVANQFNDQAAREAAARRAARDTASRDRERSLLAGREGASQSSESAGAQSPRALAAPMAPPAPAMTPEATRSPRVGVGASAPAAAPPPPGAMPGAAPAIPEFPWPPPAASASYVLPRELFKDSRTVGDAAQTVISALERSGYVERSFFRTKADGVALVTRIERINDDGTPRAGTERWPPVGNRQVALSLDQFFRGLFYVDRGRFRVIVFIIQDKPFAQSSHRAEAEEARTWLRSGLNTLPLEISERPYGGSDCSVLIYEFASDGTAVRVVDSALTGRQHLEKAGVMASLGRAN